MLFSELENQATVILGGALEGELGDGIEFVLHLDLEIMVRKDVPRALENICQFSREQPVVEIIVHPCLE